MTDLTVTTLPSPEEHDPESSADCEAARAAVQQPSYDRSALTPAVVHLGAGSFHRAHQGVYFDDLAARGETGWGVVGVGISRPELGEVMQRQDNLYLVVERGKAGTSARVIGAMIDYLLLAREKDAVVERLADPQTRLVTLTITANGYEVDEDGAAGPVFEAVAEALESRRRAGVPPFTVLSCDNLPGNGAAARAATLAAARALSDELAAWVEAEGAFPASMVDRITPSTSPELAEQIADEFHVRDNWPIVTEPFTQWVIEDRFSAGRPPLDAVGVQFVPDVSPYSTIKTRLLNGTHSALGYVGLLAGHATTADAMQDEHVARYVEHLMHDEIAPGLRDDVEGMELEPYQRVLLDRFASPAIADELTRLARRGSAKMRDYLLPSLAAAVEDDRPIDLLCLAFAAWCRCLQGHDDQGRDIEVEDPRLDELQPLAEQGAAAFLGLSDVFGDLGQDERVVRRVDELLASITDRGVAATIDEVLRAR